CSNLNPDEFIFGFLDTYGFPKSTITRLRNGDDSRNVAPGDDIGLKKKLYFRAVPTGEDVVAELETLKDSDVVKHIESLAEEVLLIREDYGKPYKPREWFSVQLMLPPFFVALSTEVRPRF